MKTINEILNIVAFLLVVNYLTYIAGKVNPDQFKSKVEEVSEGFKEVYGCGFKDNYVYNVHKLNALTIYTVKTFSIETVGGVVKLINFNKEYLTNINKIIIKNLTKKYYSIT